MKRKLLILLTIMGFISCSEEFETNENESFDSSSVVTKNLGDEKPDFHKKIILGKRLNNPYSVSSMQSAFNYYNQNVGDSPFVEKVVKATHNYIKILPTTEEHLIALDDLDKSDDETSPILHDYPLNYEIIEEGDYYIYPKDENDLYYPVYTVIPVDYQLPSNLPYEIIEPLYYPKDEEFDVETVSLVFADWQEDLKAQFGTEIYEKDLPRLLKLWKDFDEGNLTEEEFEAKGFFSGLWDSLFGRRYRPNGHVNVENTDTNNYDPLQKAKISIGRSFWWKYTYTNDNGYFSAPKKYRGKVRIRAKWRGYTATIRKTWNEILGFWVSDHLMTIKRSNNPKTKNISYTEPHDGIFGVDLHGGHLWFKGTTHNGLRKYIDYCNLNGINKTISYANVWSFARGGSSSNPMLYRYPQLPAMATIAGVGQSNFWHVMTQNISGNSISLVPWWLRPDQIYQGLRNKKINNTGNSNTVRIHQLVFHESGHYSHARKAGSWFWANVFATELSNTINEDGPYADGSQPSFQAGARIGLAEGWGTFTEFKITNFYYGKSYINSINGTGFYPAFAFNNNQSIDRFMENFNVYDRPMSFNRFDDRSWFLHGIMWDLLDDRNEIYSFGTPISKRRTGDGILINGIIDNINIGTINNFDLSPIFNALESNVDNQCDLLNRLRSNHPNLISELNQLFLSYGYICDIPVT